MIKCYRCDADGVTKEHVPPDSFFPKGYRDNLVTVPSCHEHNTKNSKDVEYVRNSLVSHITTNGVARSHFQEKVIRSFEHSPKLFERTFSSAEPIKIGDEETAIYTFDLPRFKSVMEAIAYALHYKDYGQTYYGNWGIFSPSLLSRPYFKNLPDGWDEYRLLVRQLTFTEMPVSQPDVFKYGVVNWSEQKLIYRFTFYGGFVATALAIADSGEAA